MPQHEPPPTRGRRLPLLSLLFATLLAATAAAPARAELCIVVDPVLSLGCAAHAPAIASTPAPEAAADEPVLRSRTTLEYDPHRIAVTAKRGASRGELAAAFAAAGVRVDEAIPAIRAYLLEVDPKRQGEAVRMLQASRAVATVGPEVLARALDTTPDDSEWPAQAGLRIVGLPRAWDSSRGSPAVTVAVIDTGVDSHQADLRGAVVSGVNLIDAAVPPTDDHGHGTAVAGIIAARTNNGQGMAGVCWLCQVMPVKVLDSSGTGDVTRVAAGIVWAVDHGARVLNLSLGAPGDSPQLAAALAYAERSGALIVAAAGNAGTTVPFYPAADPHSLSVAATTVDDRAYPWSSYGTWVNVAAPGCNVAPARGSGYRVFCGTSSATPIVAGVAALALSTRPTATPPQVREAIEHAATPLPAFVQFGRIDAPRALGALAPRERITNSLRGTLRRVAIHDVPAGLGLLSASVRFARGRIATVTIDSLETGARVGRVSGRSPLRIALPVPGAVRLTLRTAGARPLRYVLTYSFEPPEPSGQVDAR